MARARSSHPLLKALFSEAAWSVMKPVGQAMLFRATLPLSSEHLLNLLLRYIPGLHGHIEQIDWSFWSPRCRLSGVTLSRTVNGIPVYTLKVAHCTVAAQWKQLLRRAASLRIEMEQPVLTWNVQAPADRRSGIQAKAPSFAFRVERLLIRRGELHLQNVPGQGALDLKLVDLFVVIKNLTNSLRLAPTLEAELECRGQVMDSGRLDLNGRFYPFSEVPVFDLDAEVRGVSLPVFNPLFAEHASATVQEGELDAFIELAGNPEGYRGYVKPVVQLLAVDVTRYRSRWDALRSRLLQALARWSKNKQTHRIASMIPVQGDWHSQDVALPAAIGSFLRNAFREALQPRLEHSIHFLRRTPRDATVPVEHKQVSTAARIWRLMKASAARWSDDNAGRMSAALSYYATFSLAPLLILVIAIAGLAFGKDAAQGRIVEQITGLVGAKSAYAIQTMIEAAWKPAKGLVASVLGILTLLFGAMGVLIELKQALNRIWRAHADTGFRAIISDRLRSLGLILGVGFLMLVSLVVSAVISALGQWVGYLLPVPEFIMQAVNLFVSFLIITGLFGMIFKWLPDTAILWQDVWTGAAVTSFLFALGKSAFGIYLGKSGIRDGYGAAGSVIVILLWVYYSAMILYFGAEFTAVYAEEFGSRRFQGKL
jgi:membrane protein